VSRPEIYRWPSIDVTPAQSLQYLQRMMTTETEIAIDNWQDHIVDSAEGIRRVIAETHRIAVLGIKEGDHRPAFFVPEYAQRAGYEIVPVPVYYPEATEMLGEKVYRTISAIPGDIDMVNVFRRPHDIPPHVDDIIAKKPKSVWFQLGIRNDVAAEQLARAGIDVVQDRCLLVELRRLGK
jgi:predicted CoA-binding protein